MTTGIHETLREMQAVFFDAGNTLLEMDHGRLVEAFDPGGARGLTRERLRVAEQTIRPRLDSYLSTGASTEKLRTFFHYMELIAGEVSIPRSDSLSRAIGALLDHHRRENLWKVRVEGITTCLDHLGRVGFRLGVISNAGGDIETVLEELGLRPHFETVVDSTVVGIEKPHPGIFRLAAERLGLHPARCAYIGDLYSVDVRGARGAGMTPILLDPQGVWGEVDCLKVSSIQEFCAAIGQDGS